MPAFRAVSLRRRLQVALGVLWLVDAALQYQPFMFHQSFVTQVIEPNAVGQPAVIAVPITWMAHLIEPRVALFNAFAATVQLLIGVGLIYRRTVKLALLTSFAWAAGIWFMGEGFGMLLTGNASPLTGAPGAVLLYGLLGLIVWPRAAGGGGSSAALGERAAKGIWAALWLGSAVLWLSPTNLSASSVHDAIAAAPSGAGWLTSVQHSAMRAAAGHGVAIALMLAIVSAAVGLGAFSSRLRAPALLASMVLALGYWLLGEGLGGIFTGSATDPNSGPLLVLLAVSLYPLAPHRVAEKVPSADRAAIRMLPARISSNH